jgi:uncharacterized membrane protein (DUF4010 family)
VGALIGIERERSLKKEDVIAGVRTFILISLLGTLTALIAEQYTPGFIIASFAGLVILIGLGYAANVYLSKARGLTTEITGLLVFLLGFMCYDGGTRTIAIMLGIVVAVILAIKESIHEFAREVESGELFATLKFLVITFIILPLLPNRTIDPFDTVNPYKVWLMVILISGISYLGYVLMKLLGTERGIEVTGFLGGLASSTAVTTAMAAKVRETHSLLKPAVFATVIAGTMMLPRVLIEVSVVNANLLQHLILPMGVMLVVGITASFVVSHRKTELKTKLKLESPLALKPALKFGVLFVIVLLASSISRQYLGDYGVYMTSAIAGLVEVDAIVLSMATISARGDMGMDVAVTAILIAVIVNTFIKFIYARLLGTKEFARLVGRAFGAVIIAGLAALYFF